MSKKQNNEKVIYCAFCGTKNEKNKDNCTKCSKTLHPKNRLFLDFLYNHIKDDLKGKVKDNIFSYLKNFIISHLYGCFMCLSIIFTATVIISAPSSYKVISSIDEIRNKNEVTINVYTYDDSCATDFDEELADIPFTSAGTISGLKRSVYKINISKGSSLSTWCKDNHEKELICQETLNLYNDKIDVNAKKYREKVLEYASWVRKNGISNSKEYAKWNSILNELSYNIIPYDELKEYDKNNAVNKSVDLFVTDIGCSYEY